MHNTGFIISGFLVTHLWCCCCPNPEGFRGVHRGTLRALEFEKTRPCGYQGVHRGTLRALDDKQGPNPVPPPQGSQPFPQGPHPTNYETQSQF